MKCYLTMRILDEVLFVSYSALRAARIENVLSIHTHTETHRHSRQTRRHTYILLSLLFSPITATKSHMLLNYRNAEREKKRGRVEIEAIQLQQERKKREEKTAR